MDKDAKQREEKYIAAMSERSIVLHWNDKAWLSTHGGQMLDLSTEAILDRIEELKTIYSFRTATWKQALKEWKDFVKAQPNPRKKRTPTGLTLDEIITKHAKVVVAERELRTLNLEILPHSEKMAKEVRKQAQQKAVRHLRLGAVKYVNSEPFTCDGRKLVRDADGEWMFEDDGVLLGDYLEEVGASKRRKRLEERKRQVLEAPSVHAKIREMNQEDARKATKAGRVDAADYVAELEAEIDGQA
jgi:hypothetical protein